MRAPNKSRVPVAIAFLLLCQAAGSTAALQTQLFETPEILRIDLAIAPDQVDSLRRSPKVGAIATVSENGKTYTNVALHLKGLGSFRPIDAKPSFSIKFNEHTPGVRFHGQTRILLENSVQDPTYLRRKLTSELAQRAGLPAARVSYAIVTLNGRKLGLYTLSEAMNKDFLARTFGDSSGNLYEGGDQDIWGRVELDSGNAPDGALQLQALIDACREPDPARRWERLRATLDLDRFISFMAFEVLITHHDGYSLDLNNYRFYRDPKTARFVFIPHGMDLVLNRPTLPLDPAWRGIVASAVVNTEQGKQLYRERVLRLGREMYGNEALTERVSALTAFIQPAVAELGAAEVTQFNNALGALRTIIQQRRAFVFGGSNQ
jgi:spore coat protein H